MEVNKIVNGVQTLQKLNEQELSLATTLKIIKNSEEFDKVLKIFSEKRNSILQDFDQDTASDQEGMKVASEIQSLLNEEVDIEFSKLTKAELENIKISALELSSILWLFEDV